jgi:deoxyribodipyrimidine photo-lyase
MGGGGTGSRGWKVREVFGKVRHMSVGDLERKARPEEYVEKVERSIEEHRAEALSFLGVSHQL